MGHAQVPFSLQSISKVFTLTLALGMVGDNAVETKLPEYDELPDLEQSMEVNQGAG